MKDVLQRAKEFEQKAAKTDIDVGKSIEALTIYGERNRQLIRWVIASIVIEIILVLFLGFIFTQQKFSQVQIENNQNALIAACNSGNEFRKTNLTLWNYILNLPSSKKRTPQEKRKIAKFKVFINKTFAPRDCSNING